MSSSSRRSGPFFLDGSEQFNVLNNLIYTRRIVQPVAAVKLTGKGLGTDIGFLSAVDDQSVSATGEIIRCTTCCELSGTSGRARGWGWSTPIGSRVRAPIAWREWTVGGSREPTARSFSSRGAGPPRPASPRPRRSSSAASSRTAARFGFPRHLQRIRPRLPRAQRILPPARLLARQLPAAGVVLRSVREPHGEPHRRCQPRRTLPLGSVRHLRRDAGREDPPQRQPDPVRRLARRGLGADRAVRLSIRGVHRLSAGAAARRWRPRHGRVRRRATRFPTGTTC